MVATQRQPKHLTFGHHFDLINFFHLTPARQCRASPPHYAILPCMSGMSTKMLQSEKSTIPWPPGSAISEATACRIYVSHPLISDATQATPPPRDATLPLKKQRNRHGKLVGRHESTVPLRLPKYRLYFCECKHCPFTESLTLASLGMVDEDEVTFAVWESGDLFKKTSSPTFLVKE